MVTDRVLKAFYKHTILKLHTLQLSLKQINKILGQIEGYLFFLPFCSEKNLCENPRHPYRLWKNAEVCSLQNSAVPINLRIFTEKRSADKSISKKYAYTRT